MESDRNGKREATMDIKWDGRKNYRKNECGMCGKGDHLRQCSACGCYVHTKCVLLLFKQPRGLLICPICKRHAYLTDLRDRGAEIDSPDAEQYMYPLDRYLGAKPGLTEPEEWRPEAPPPSPSNDSDFFERAQSVVREAETQLECFKKIYNIESESDKQQPKVTQGVVSPQVSHPSRMHNIVAALDALQAESSCLEDNVLRAKAFAKDISNELKSDHKPSKSGRTCHRHPCERRTRKLVSERSQDPQESVKDTATVSSRRKQAKYPRSEVTSANTYDIEQKKLSPTRRRQNQRSTWHTNLLRAKSSTEGADDGRRYKESHSNAEKRCKCAINKKKCLCLLYHRQVPEKSAVEAACVCRECSRKEIKSSQKWQLSRHQSNINICPCCEQEKRDHVETVVKKKYTPGCCKATLIDVKTKHWSTEEEEEVARKKLPLSRLTIQELPSINIRRELKIQKVPSIDLPKPPGEEIPYTPRENVGLIDYTHEDRIRERQSRWRKGDDIRRSSYIGERISESEVHRAHRIDKEMIVIHPPKHSSNLGPSEPCTHKASRSSPCQCSLRSKRSVRFSGVAEHTFMFDLNHGRSFSLERRSSETEYSGIEASEIHELRGLRDSNFGHQPFDDMDSDSETGDICVHCQSLSCSSRHCAAGKKPVSKFSSKERPREKQESRDNRPVPKPKKQIPVPQERKQDMGPVRPSRKSENWPCKSRKTLEQARTADVYSTLQHREESIQTGVPLARDKQEETAVSGKPQQLSSILQASAEPQSPPPKNRKHLVQSTITQTSYTPQEGPSTSRQWEQSLGAEPPSLPYKSRKNLVQARTTGTSFTPEERPSILHHRERSLGGDQAGTKPRSPPLKHRRNLVQAVTTQTSYTPEEGPTAFHQPEQSLGAEPQSPPRKHTKNLSPKREPTMTAVPKTKIARQDRKTFPFPDSSYIPIAAMAPFPSSAKDQRTKHSELRKTVPRAEKACERHRTGKMDQNSVFPDVSYIPMVIQSPKGIQALHGTNYRDEAVDDCVNSRPVPSTSPRQEVPSPSDTPTITVYSSKQQKVKADREHKEEVKVGSSCGRPGERCSRVAQRKERNVKVEESEASDGERDNFDLNAKPNVDSVHKSKRDHIQSIYNPLLTEMSCEDPYKTSSNNETAANVPVESQSSTSFIPQEDLSAKNAVAESVRVGGTIGSSGITVSDFLSSGSTKKQVLTARTIEEESALGVSDIPFLIPDRLDQTNMRLPHTSQPPSMDEQRKEPQTSSVNVHGPGRSRGGITPVFPDAPESPEEQRGSGDVTSSMAIRNLQQAILSRVEEVVMRGLLNESELSDSPSEVTPPQQVVASPEAAALPAEYEEDFESEEESAEDEPLIEDILDSEATAQSEDSQESSLPTSQEAAVQTSFLKPSCPSQTFPEAAVQTSLTKLSSSSAASAEVGAPTSPSKSSISPRPSDPTPPCSPSKKLSDTSGHTSQRPSLSSPARTRKPSSSLAQSLTSKKKYTDLSLDSSPKKYAAETPTELSPPRTPALSPKKASPLRSPVKTPPLSPGSGSSSPIASVKKTPLLSADSSSDTEEQAICVATPPITPPRSPSPSLSDAKTPSPTQSQHQYTESSQSDKPFQLAPEPRRRRVEEEILIPIVSERTDVSSRILSDSVATDRTSETLVSVDQEETALSEGEIRGCCCKNCRRTCECSRVSTGEVRRSCYCGRSVGEVQSQTDDSIGEVHHHKHTGHRCQSTSRTPRHSHRSSTYSEGQAVPRRVHRRQESSYSVGEVAHHDGSYSAGQIVVLHEQSARMERHIEVYLSSSLTGQSSDAELSSCASLCGAVFDQEIHLPALSNASDEPSLTIHSIGELSEDDSGS